MSCFKVECDKCKQQFMISEDLIGVEGVIPYGKAHFFMCPSCGYKYMYMLEDREQHEFMIELDNIQNRINLRRERGKEIPPFLIKRFQKVLDEIMNHQAFLRNKYEKVVTDQLNKSDVETNS